MSRILLCHLDGKLPNLALMRLSAHHRALGDSIEICHGAAFETSLFDEGPFDFIYASAVFGKSRPLVERLLRVYPNAIVGGTGWNVSLSLESLGITDSVRPDYSLYPRFSQSLGFTQRGCRLRCSFCVVPKKEGSVRQASTVHDVWRGSGHPRELLLLDNDFFGQQEWRDRINEIREGGFKVSFNQGINARFLTDEAAEAVASVNYRDDSMATKRIYTAWDNLKDEHRLFAGLNRLVKYGVKPDHIMVYMLCGYWPGETQTNREHRRKALRDFGARPYPMPYIRTPELVGFQRWVIGAYDKPTGGASTPRVPWRDFMGASYRPEKLTAPTFPLFEAVEASV